MSYDPWGDYHRLPSRYSRSGQELEYVTELKRKAYILMQEGRVEVAHDMMRKAEYLAHQVNQQSCWSQPPDAIRMPVRIPETPDRPAMDDELGLTE